MTAIKSNTAAGLLPETFVHLSGIGLRTEIKLWRAGIGSWSALAQTPLARRPAIAASLAESERALLDRDLAYFFSTLPASERWRTYADFGDDFAAVDIETTGLSVYDQVTVVGIEMAGEYRAFIRGANLAEAGDLLSEARGLVTFNGAAFDLPFLARTFPQVSLPACHVDLRFLARRVGWTGSLKKVERLAGVRRGEELDDIGGFEATVLWSEFEHGSVRSLKRLVSYNAADACVLRPIADLVVDRLRDELEARRQTPLDEEQLTLELEALVPVVRRLVRRAPAPPAVRARGDVLRTRFQTISLPPRRSVRPLVTLDALEARMRDPLARIVGVDLTGSDERPSGWALVADGYVVTGMLNSFDELVERTLAAQPALVSIDSPLSLPLGRDCTSDLCACRAAGGITRHCERELKRRGINVYPSLIQSMQALTQRGIRLAAALRDQGIEVIESYPGAAQDILRIPRKRASQDQLRTGLERFGLRGIRAVRDVTHDELDAITSAVVGAFYLADLYEGLGTNDEDYLIIPSLAQLGSVQTASSNVRSTEPRLFVIGREHSTTAARALAKYDPILGDWSSYWNMLAAHGAALRAAELMEPGQRKPRRPAFVDVALRVDDLQLTRKLRRWARSWSR